MEPARNTLAQRLKRIDVFADLAQPDLEWLSSRMETARYEPGDVVSEEGSPANRMVVVLEGELRIQRDQDTGDGRTYSAHTGQVTGMLPYSRLTTFPLTTRAMTTTELAFLNVSHFPELIERLPALAGRLVGLMSDRIRETTRADQQRDKLMALGKLSAGLAHELNNPASAVRNAAGSLQDAVGLLRSASLRLGQRAPSAEVRVFLAQLECDWSKHHPPVALDSLDRSDREEALGEWMEKHGVGTARQLAPDLVDSGCDIETLRALAERFGDGLEDAATHLAASLTINKLVEQIDRGTARMTDLVQAIKEYSYMDQSPVQEMDVHDGLENTLLMLHYRLKHGISVVREYDRSIPRICGHGSELNQVWTNLIDNAIDAMNGKGELVVRTASEFGRVLIEIRDSGPGIPPGIRDRIFEPFFTTKPVGEGTGLGLDTVYRIVRQHHGDIQVESRPGRTSFQVRIPFAR